MSTVSDERAALCDLLAKVGPSAPTLCEGWTARHLAAHILVRERRPDAAPGIVVPLMARYTNKIMTLEADRPWDQLVDLVRSGPPSWSPAHLTPVDRLINTVELFVHHEDLRRAQPDWEPRELPAAARNELATAVRRSARLLARKAPGGLVVEMTDVDGENWVKAKSGAASVTAHGPVGEIVLFLYGRGSHSKVALDGPDDLVARMRTARFGL